MADLIEVEGGMALKLNPEDGEACVVVSKDGEVVFFEAHPDQHDDAEPSPQAWITSGIAAAFSDPELFEELRQIAARAHDLHWEPAEIPADCPSKLH